MECSIQNTSDHFISVSSVSFFVGFSCGGESEIDFLVASLILYCYKEIPVRHVTFDIHLDCDVRCRRGTPAGRNIHVEYIHGTLLVTYRVNMSLRIFYYCHDFT
jgi:hypothetical protein